MTEGDRLAEDMTKFLKKYGSPPIQQEAPRNHVSEPQTLIIQTFETPHREPGYTVVPSTSQINTALLSALERILECWHDPQCDTMGEAIEEAERAVKQAKQERA